jgi:hypothetical protein
LLISPIIQTLNFTKLHVNNDFASNLKIQSKPGVAVLDFLFMLGNTYETEIRFCAAAGVAGIGCGFHFQTTLGERRRASFGQ